MAQMRKWWEYVLPPIAKPLRALQP